MRHGRPPISVFMEVGRDGVEVFVRDHGDGFDMSDIGEDRLGVRESIIGRMKRADGSARIRRLDNGTEVSLTLPPAATESPMEHPDESPGGSAGENPGEVTTRHTGGSQPAGAPAATKETMS